MKFDVIVPIYNVVVSDVPVFQLSVLLNNVCIHVCDNSTDAHCKMKNQDICTGFNDADYLDMEGNKGLSSAYNAAIGNCEGDLVCFFDDDTNVDGSYFDEIAKEYQINGEGVYLPIIYSKGSMLSPLKTTGPLIYRVKNVDKLDQKHISAFNSGMVCTINIARSIMHDDDLFLDYVDHAFCREILKRDIPCYIVENAKLEQNYSRETNDFQSALFRSGIAEPDIKTYYAKSHRLTDCLYSILYINYLRIRNSAKYKSLRFFPIFKQL